MWMCYVKIIFNIVIIIIILSSLSSSSSTSSSSSLELYYHNWWTSSDKCFFFSLSPGSISVMFSRLYLGVHSPADIVAGGIIGCVILASWIKIDTILDRFISFGDNGMYRHCFLVTLAMSILRYQQLVL